MFKTCNDLTRLWVMLDEDFSRSRMLNQTVPSKGHNDVLFTLYYTLCLKDYNSYVSHCVIVSNNKTIFFNQLSWQCKLVIVNSF